jgi:transcriptional regulator with XRE-family HTH domain
MSRGKTPGEILIVHLQKRGLTQSQLADELMVHPATVSKLVKNQRRPSMEVFAELSSIFGPVFVLEYIEALTNGEAARKFATRPAGSFRQQALPE